jgi:hypothetical protein
MLIKLLRIASDNAADGCPRGMNIILRQRPADRLNVIEKTAASEQRRDEQGKHHLAQSGRQEQTLDEPRNDGRDCNNGDERRNARSTPQRRAVTVAIQEVIKLRDERAYPGDGMPDAAIEARRIAEENLD